MSQLVYWKYNVQIGMKKIDEYTQDELVALYKRLGVYATTWWFKYYRTYKLKPEEKDSPMIKILTEKYHSNPSRVIAYIKSSWASNEKIDMIYQKLLRHNQIDYEIGQLKQDEEKNYREIKKLQYEREAFLNVYRSLWWFGGEHESYVERYDQIPEPDDWASPEDLEFELGSNDDLNTENGLATDYEVYQFIWETLQYLNVEQLAKLLKFAENGIENKWVIIPVSAGRKSRQCEIKQVDIETGEVVGVYSARNDLMAKTGIKKSHLAQCIKTAKDNPKNRNEWKKWIGPDCRKYGFVEVLVN